MSTEEFLWESFSDNNMSAVPTELVADTSGIVEIVEIPDVVSLV